MYVLWYFYSVVVEVGLDDVRVYSGCLDFVVDGVGMLG